MKLAIFIRTAPFSDQSSWSAYRFCIAALGQGHQLSAIFFYQDGIQNGNTTIQVSADEPHLGKLWSQLAEQHQLTLSVCSSAAHRRGAFAEPALNLAPHFKITGLGQWVQASTQADRVLSFGGKCG